MVDFVIKNPAEKIGDILMQKVGEIIELEAQLAVIFHQEPLFMDLVKQILKVIEFLS